MFCVYLWAATSLPLTVGQEAAEEWKVHAVMQSQQVVFSELEACGILRPQLPHAVEKQQEHRGLPERKVHHTIHLEQDSYCQFKQSIAEMRKKSAKVN